LKMSSLVDVSFYLFGKPNLQFGKQPLLVLKTKMC
jgi:hypothetical protein